MLRLLLTTLLPLSLICACGGGGGGGGEVPGGEDDQGFAELSACMLDGFSAAAALTDAFDNLFDEINGTPRASVTLWDPMSGAYTMDADLLGDAFAETTVSGQVQNLAGDYADGLAAGDTIQVNWDLNGPIQGADLFTFEFLANNQVKLTGGAFLLFVGTVCDWRMIDIDLTFSTLIDSPPTGTFDFTVTIDGNTLAGTVTMNGTAIANVAATLNGVAKNFQIDTDDFTLVP